MRPIALAGAAVVVTGGARGIGLATAKQFVARGAQVYICRRCHPRPSHP